MSLHLGELTGNNNHELAEWFNHLPGPLTDLIAIGCEPICEEVHVHLQLGQHEQREGHDGGDHQAEK